MVVLLLYAYCVGIPSSRKIEKACWEDAAFRVLTGNQQPDQSRISDFRRRHLGVLAGLFVQVLRLCQKAGLVSLGHVPLDGTKVKANASKHKAMSHGRMLKSEKQLEAEMRALPRKAELIDAQEDSQIGREKWGDELPEELKRRSSRLEWIRKAKAELEAEAAAAKAAQRQQEAAAADQEATEAEARGDDQTIKRAARRGRGARRRADDAHKLAIEKAEAAGHEPPDITAAGVSDLLAMPQPQLSTDAAGNPKPQAQRNFSDPDSHILCRWRPPGDRGDRRQQPSQRRRAPAAHAGANPRQHRPAASSADGRCGLLQHRQPGSLRVARHQCLCLHQPAATWPTVTAIAGQTAERPRCLRPDGPQAQIQGGTSDLRPAQARC